MDVLQPCAIIFYQQVGGHGVAGMQLVQFALRFNFVRHRHRVHEPGYRFAIYVDHMGAVIDGNDFAFEVEDLGSSLRSALG